MTNTARLTVLALIMLIAAGCDAMPKPTAKIVGATLQDISLDSAQLLFDVEVSNPYMVSLPMLDADYALASRGVQFLSGDAPLAGSIPAGESAVLPLPVKIDFLQLIDALEGVIPGSVVPYDADLGLSVDAPLLGRLRLPMARQGEINVPSLMDIQSILAQ
jgi:LEA14-like dessication related protein